ncbi:MAG: prepilin-type N-terminal cleavage/methylation domain-containing protein [Candidatus Omnitrophica bacterium]|nr:prepilin-type N-terminal cleavage/methylation domain-containing protein [Candidatus Omnitrophota bacterium]
MKKLFSEKGFTLIEVSLVSVLLVVVMATILSTYRAGFKVWEKADEIRLGDRDIELSFEKIKGELSGYTRKFKGVLFSGEEKKLVFSAVEAGQIQEITYEFKQFDKMLLRKSMPFTLSLKKKNKDKEDSLFRADKIKFSYMITEGAEGDVSWKDSFVEDEGQELFAVKIDITRDDKKFSRTVIIPR